jgi:carboxymethylenebutenolidase
MCLGGHLALRVSQIMTSATELTSQAAFDPRVLATFCWFGTDVHSATLGAGQKDDTLERVAKGELCNKGEVAMVFGLQDNHVPREGRDKIRAAMNDAGVEFSVSHG